MARVSIAIVIAAVCGAAPAPADSWIAPYEQDYYSANKAYYLHVVPGDGAPHARGTLNEAARREGDDLRVWSAELLNPAAPHKVLVADSGEYVVTFDDWGRVGYGDNVVVIYGAEGDVVKNFALEDLLTEEEIADVPHSTSSRWWGDEHYLDEAAGVVVLLVVAGPPEPDGEFAYRVVRVRLSDGEVLP